MKILLAGRRPARERLLAAAEELFYQEGVQSVGIDRIVERAGVAKASLYSNFKGKDDLVRAYLNARQEARRAAIETKLALHKAPRARMLAVFDAMTEPLAKPNYRGCAFLRATAEMPADASGREVCRDARTLDSGSSVSPREGSRGGESRHARQAANAALRRGRGLGADGSRSRRRSRSKGGGGAPDRHSLREAQITARRRRDR